MVDPSSPRSTWNNPRRSALLSAWRQKSYVLRPVLCACPYTHPGSSCLVLPHFFDNLFIGDWASLPQKGLAGEPRSAEEEERFKRGLQGMGNLYASMTGTTVLQQKEVSIPSGVDADGFNLRAYDGEGGRGSSTGDLTRDLLAPPSNSPLSRPLAHQSRSRARSSLGRLDHF